MTFDSYYEQHWVPKNQYFQIHRRRFVQSWNLLVSMDLPSKGTVLDIGGAGPMSMYLQEHGWETRITTSDLRSPLDVPSGEFDLVICTETIEHIKDVDSTEISDLELFNYSGVIQMLGELKRAMKPLGALLITTPNANSYLTLSKWLSGEVLLMDPSHVREFSIRDLLRVTSEVGLEAVYIGAHDSWSEQIPREVTELVAVLESVPGILEVERNDNIFGVFRRVGVTGEPRSHSR